MPLAFRTDLGWGEDSQEEVEFLPTGAATVAESDPQPSQPVTGTNSTTALSRSGRVYRVNDRSGRLFTGTIGTAKHKRSSISLENQWIDERFQNDPDLLFTPLADTTESIAIVAPKTTDVLRVRPQTIPAGLQLDPISSAGTKAAYYSSVFILKAVAADRLGIDPDEFDISNVRQVQLPGGARAGEIIISDHLLNGTGFTAWVYDNWQDLLASMTNSSAENNKFIDKLLGTVHQTNCDSSCYSCLRNYRNMSYHGLLDWRLGMSLLRSLRSASFRCGLDSNFSPPDLIGWVDRATKLRNSFCNAFQTQTHQFGPLPGLKIGDRQVLVIHPLWDTGNPTGVLAEALASCSKEKPRDIGHIQPATPSSLGLPAIRAATIKALNAAQGTAARHKHDSSPKPRRRPSLFPQADKHARFGSPAASDVTRTFVVRQRDESPRRRAHAQSTSIGAKTDNMSWTPYSCTDSGASKNRQIDMLLPCLSDHIGKSKPTLSSALTTAASYRTVPFGGGK